MLQTISITVFGKVQGVFYRQSTREKAIELGITGYIKNMPDDTVYILATGSTEQLDKLSAWCRQGPPKARVSHIDVKELPIQQFPNFRIERF